MVADDNRPMDTTFSFAGTVHLRHWGVIRARGSDAVKFLQGQLTNDLTTLTPSQVRPAGFCSAKGRLQASFLIWKAADDELLLACSASVLAATLKRLSMFVMRAQCKLTDVSAELALWGVAGDAAEELMHNAGVGDDTEKVDVDGASLIRLPAVDGIARLIFASAVSAPRLAESSVQPAGTPTDAAPPAALAMLPVVSLDTWRWLEVRSGLSTIEAATVDQFVPQMLNYDIVGGVDFRKGCYPGQEIVARSQYRGTIKRRMFLFDVDVDVPAAPGQEVFHSEDPGQPAGQIVNAAPHPTGPGASVLVEVKLAMLDSGSLHLATPDGAMLRQSTLPYAVPIDATPPTT